LCEDQAKKFIKMINRLTFVHRLIILIDLCCCTETLMRHTCISICWSSSFCCLPCWGTSIRR